MVRPQQIEPDRHPFVEPAESREIETVFQTVMTVEMSQKSIERIRETRPEFLDPDFSSLQVLEGCGSPRAFAPQVLVNGKPETAEALDVEVTLPILAGIGGAQIGDFVRQPGPRAKLQLFRDADRQPFLLPPAPEPPPPPAKVRVLGSRSSLATAGPVHGTVSVGTITIDGLDNGPHTPDQIKAIWLVECDRATTIPSQA